MRTGLLAPIRPPSRPAVLARSSAYHSIHPAFSFPRVNSRSPARIAGIQISRSPCERASVRLASHSLRGERHLTTTGSDRPWPCASGVLSPGAARTMSWREGLEVAVWPRGDARGAFARAATPLRERARFWTAWCVPISHFRPLASRGRRAVVCPLSNVLSTADAGCGRPCYYCRPRAHGFPSRHLIQIADPGGHSKHARP